MIILLLCSFRYCSIGEAFGVGVEAGTAKWLQGGDALVKQYLRQQGACGPVPLYAGNGPKAGGGMRRCDAAS